MIVSLKKGIAGIAMFRSVVQKISSCLVSICLASSVHKVMVSSPQLDSTQDMIRSIKISKNNHYTSISTKIDMRLHLITHSISC